MLTHSTRRSLSHSRVHTFISPLGPHHCFHLFCFDLNAIACLIMQSHVHSMWVLHNIVLLSADDALHLLGSSMLSADSMQDDTAQMPDCQLMLALLQALLSLP